MGTDAPKPKKKYHRVKVREVLRAVHTVTEVHNGASEEFPGAEYTREEVELLKAVDAYRRRTGRKFPMVTEYLAIIESLGWRRVAQPGPLPTYPIVHVEDMSKEAADARARTPDMASLGT